MTQTDHAHMTSVPLADLRSAYPTSELLSRPVLDAAGAKMGLIADLLMQGDHLAFAILAIGDYVGISGRRVVVAIEDLSIVDKAFVMAAARPDNVGELTVYDPGYVSKDGIMMRAGRRGVKDAGHIVTTALGEPISGVIADVADGDR